MIQFIDELSQRKLNCINISGIYFQIKEYFVCYFKQIIQEEKSIGFMAYFLISLSDIDAVKNFSLS